LTYINKRSNAKNKTKKIDLEQIMETYGLVDYDGIDIINMNI
jgi:hypothetical protein